MHSYCCILAMSVRSSSIFLSKRLASSIDTAVQGRLLFFSGSITVTHVAVKHTEKQSIGIYQSGVPIESQ